jgi:ferredoxin-NADP reductase
LHLVVARRETVADDVVALTLRPADGLPLPVWTPGAHVDLEITERLTRQYSLCGDVEDRTAWRVAVLREAAGRGGSAHVHDHAHQGAELRAHGLRNRFELLPSQRYLFVAGGIGITPILPMVAAARRAGADWTLLYGGRTSTSMAFVPEIRALACSGAQARIQPYDRCGKLDLEGFLARPRDDTLVYACGPEPLLRAVAERWERLGGKPAALRTERFANPQHEEPDHPISGFDVVLARSGLALSVGPAESILEVVEQAGIPVLSSCREGRCGTCEIRVLEGRPDHRDSLLTEQDREGCDTMLICVSRSLGGRLVLDL